MSRQRVEEFWAAHDKNNDGVLSVDEVKSNLKSPGQCKMSGDAVDAMFKELGLDSGSNVTKEVFMKAFETKRKECLKAVFARMDKDGSGKLNGQEVMAILMAEDLYSKDDLDALFLKCKDSDGDDSVNCAEFIEAAF